MGTEKAEMKERGRFVFSRDDTNLAKGVALLLMMFHHCFLSEDRFEDYTIIFSPLGKQMTMDIAAFFKICVGMFAFLSTYGITISLKKVNNKFELSRKQYEEALFKRWFNLMSGYLFIFVLCQIFCALMDGRPREIYGGEGKLTAFFYILIDAMGMAKLFGTPMLIATWWYMSLALLIIFLMPVMVHLYSRFGTLFIIMFSIMFVRIFSFKYGDIIIYFFAFAMGIVFADKDLLARLKGYKICKNYILNKFLKLVISSALLILSFYVRRDVEFLFMAEIRYIVIPVLVIYMGYEFLSDIPVLNSFLRFTGRHSMNIFLFHSFIRQAYFEEFIYGFRYIFLIVAVLFGVSLVVSILIEFVKKYLGYNKFTVRVREKACGRLFGA